MARGPSRPAHLVLSADEGPAPPPPCGAVSAHSHCRGDRARGTAGPRAAWAHRLAPPSPPADLGQAAKVLLPLPPGGDGGQQQPQKRLSAELRRYILCQKLQAIFESVLCLLTSLCLNFKIKFAHFKPVTLA